MSFSFQSNRSIRVFVSSTFRDMKEEREALMSHTWPALRKFCRERKVEFLEVDLRWGISEEQSNKNETLRLCLQEIHACRPYFIGLIGERYGWVPGPEAFTPDLLEEEPWLSEHWQKSVTELEFLHGVLNNPEMAGHALIYIRDPVYAQACGAAYLPENVDTADKQAALKATVRSASATKSVTLRENYANPHQLAALVLEDLKAAIEAEYPEEAIPDPLAREACDHEAFAEVRRRTYIARPDYFEQLDQNVMNNRGPLVLIGESGGGKSALLANWVSRWRGMHPADVIIQHYIGSTQDSADHWQLMRRLITEIKLWTVDAEEVPRTHDELLKGFPVWLAKARSMAEHTKVRCILVLDALNQLDAQDRARVLGWLPTYSFSGSLCLITSTLSGETWQATQQRGWNTLTVKPLTEEERRRMIAVYLASFSKKLDQSRSDRLATASQSANPLYLKILLDELRVTGTHEQLDEQLHEYLAQPDIPALLKTVLARYQRDYENDRPGLVRESLSLIWAARRGLSESELLELLKLPDRLQLPMATWAPLRAALEDLVVKHGGLLNFSHDYVRAAVESSYVSGKDHQDKYRLRLADYFEQQPVAPRGCGELPWLLKQTESFARLLVCLIDIERFLILREHDQDELIRYWVGLPERQAMGASYVASFQQWEEAEVREPIRISIVAYKLSLFLYATAQYTEAEPLMRRALATVEQHYGPEHPNVASNLNDLAQLLKATNRLADAEPLLRRALAITEQSYGPNHPDVARDLNSLAELLRVMNRLEEAEPLYRRALAIKEQSYGFDHPEVTTHLNNLALLFQVTSRLKEAEPLYRRALAIMEQSYGSDHPRVAIHLNNLAGLLQTTNRLAESEPLMRRALAITEQSYGPDHPDVARDLNNLAALLRATNRLVEAEPLLRRSLAIMEQNYGPDHPKVSLRLSNLAELLQATNRLAEAEPLLRRSLTIMEQSYGSSHPDVARSLNNLAELLRVTNRLTEAEPLIRRALAITEQSYGSDHPDVARNLNNLAVLLQVSNQMAEAEPLMRRALAIMEQSYGPDHPEVARSLNNLAELLRATNRLVEAEPLLRCSLAIIEQSYGPDHPEVAIRLSNLALLLQSQNRLTEAEPLLCRALAIDEQSYGPDHPTVAIRLNNLASLLKATNRLAEAESLLRRALGIDEQSYGQDHPDVAAHLNNLALLLQAMNRLAEAEPLLRQALAMAEGSYGHDHPNVANILNNLAELLRATNRLVEAEPLMCRAVTIFLKFGKATGHAHPCLKGVVGNYAQLLFAMRHSTHEVFKQLNALGEPYGISLGDSF